jgi:hypothetical protein
MSFIMLPALISNLLGGYYANRYESIFDFTTLGNQKGYEDGTDDPDCLNINDDNRALRAIAITSDVVNTISLYIFLIIFHAISRRKLFKIKKTKQSPGDYSIYVTGFPDDFINEEEIREHFKQYGEIVEVVLTRRFKNMMNDYLEQDKVNKLLKKREINVKIKAEEKGEDVGDAVKNDKKCQKLIEKDNKNEEMLREKYPTIKSVEDVSSIGAFVVFNKSEDMLKCLKFHRKLRLGTVSRNTVKLKEKHMPKIAQADEPNNILWENLEVNFFESFMRSLLTIFVVILLLILSFFAVYGLRVYQNSLPTLDDCDQYKDFTLATVDKTNQDALDCVCRDQGIYSIASDSSLHDDCGDYLNTSIVKYVVNVLVGVLVSVINFIIKYVFNYLSHFERYKTLTGLSTTIMKKAFIATFINLAILYLMINANFQGSGFISGIADGIPGGNAFFFAGDYSDLSRDWYSKVASSIIVLVLSGLFSTALSSFLAEIYG